MPKPMTPEELRQKMDTDSALLQKTVNQLNEVKEANAKLAEQIVKSDLAITALTEKGGELPESVKTQIGDLENEISDLRSKMKTPIAAITDEQQQKALSKMAHTAVAQFVKSGEKDDIYKYVADHATEQAKALNIADPASAGLAIAEVLARDVMDYARELSPVLGHIGRKPALTRNYRQLIKVTYPTVRKGSENNTGTNPANTDTQTYVEVKSNDFKVSAEPRITDEAMSAPDIDVYGDLVESMGDEIGIYLADQILYGDGTDGEARGILGSRLDITNLTGEAWKPTLGTGRRNSDSYPAYATGVSGAIGTDDKSMVDFVIQSMAKLPQRYRKGAKWYMNENTKVMFELIRDANDNPIFRSDFRTGEFNLNGKPVVIDDTLPDVGVDAAFAIYGDLGRAMAINDGDINKMQINPFIIRGCTVVEYDKEMFEIVQRSDAILIMVATTNAKA